MSSISGVPTKRRRNLRPLQRHHALSIATCVVLFIAFVLFLFVALSLPIIKPVYILSLHGSTQPGQPETGIATELRFGVWGLCATSELNEPKWYSNDGYCIGPMLGYQLSDQILSLAGEYEAVAKIVLKALTVLLVLHPVVCGLSWLGMFTSLWIASHTMLILSLIVTIVNALVSTLVFAIDLGIVIVARKEVSKLDEYNFTVGFGNAVWMSMVAALMTWIGVILLSIPVCGCCGTGRKYHQWEASQMEKKQAKKRERY